MLIPLAIYCDKEHCQILYGHICNLVTFYEKELNHFSLVNFSLNNPELNGYYAMEKWYRDAAVYKVQKQGVHIKKLLAGL